MIFASSTKVFKILIKNIKQHFKKILKVFREPYSSRSFQWYHLTCANRHVLCIFDQIIWKLNEDAGLYQRIRLCKILIHATAPQFSMRHGGENMLTWFPVLYTVVIGHIWWILIQTASERRAQMNLVQQKQSNIVHDLIMGIPRQRRARQPR